MLSDWQKKKCRESCEAAFQSELDIATFFAQFWRNIRTERGYGYFKKLEAEMPYYTSSELNFRIFLHNLFHFQGGVHYHLERQNCRIDPESALSNRAIEGALLIYGWETVKTMATYYYLITEAELASAPDGIKQEFDELYPPGHPLSLLFSAGPNDYYFGLSDKQGIADFWCDIWYGKMNPVTMDRQSLTHYILRKSDDAIAGTVVYDRDRGMEFYGTLNDGTKLFSTCGQTSYLTELDIEEYESPHYFKDYYLWQLQIMWLPTPAQIKNYQKSLAGQD